MQSWFGHAPAKDQSTGSDSLSDDSDSLSGGSDSPSGDSGVVSIEYVIGLTLFIAFMLFALNVAFAQYTRGAVRSAAAEGARAGAPADRGIGECQQVGVETLDQLLGASLGNRVGLRCMEVEGSMVAQAVGTVEPWIGFMPTVDVSIEVVVAKELDL